MKVCEINCKPTTVLLGVFSTDTFKEINKTKKVFTYHKFWEWIAVGTGIVETVKHACSKADMIIFVLDDVHFPISSESYTCRELEMICKNDHIFNKTVFVKGEDVINFDKHLVYH